MESTDTQQLKCSITGQPMQVPVVGYDGHIYEKEAIEKYLTEHGTSPCAKHPMSNQSLIPYDPAIHTTVLQFHDTEDKAEEQEEEMEMPDLSQLSLSKKTSFKSYDPSKGDTPNHDGMELHAFLDENNLCRFSLSIPEPKECPPMDLVCCIDISGSMGWSCSGVNDGRTEYVELGFSLMDLVKHAMKTVILTMRPQDRLFIIKYNRNATRCLQWTNMDEAGQKQANGLVEAFYPQGGTSSFNALKDAIMVISDRNGDKAKRNASILFFTDGQSTPPAGGEINCLRQLRQDKKFKYPIHAMGFGQYDRLNSDLLFQISELFGGQFGYIPDPTNIGTIFVNAISNIMTTANFHNDLDLFFEAGYEYVKTGKFQVQVQKDKMKINVDLQSLRFGQSLDFIVQFPKDTEIDKTKFIGKLSYDLQGAPQQLQFTDNPFTKVSSSENVEHKMRFECIDLLQIVMDNYKKKGSETYVPMVQAKVNEYRALKIEEGFVFGMLDTLERQTIVSLGKDKYMDKWGHHQYKQLIRSLTLQIKNNFRDPCMAFFGGELFTNLSDAADDIYNSLDPPKPSLTPPKQASVAAVPQSAEQFAAVYNNNAGEESYGGGNGCFTGESMIKMADGSYKMVKHLNKSDKVFTPYGPSAVRCLIKMLNLGGKVNLCTLSNGLKVTPGHPILVENVWKYPRDIVEVKNEPCEFVFNIVLEDHHIVSINETNVILLGHNYKQGILKHEYLGSQKVVNDLMKFQGWQNGLIVLNAGSMNKANGIRVGFEQTAEIQV